MEALYFLLHYIYLSYFTDSDFYKDVINFFL